MLWAPARDRLARVAVHTNDSGKGHQHSNGVTVAKAIDEIVIILLGETRLSERIH